MTARCSSMLRRGTLTGTKLVTDLWACTVLVDDEPIVSCLVPAVAASSCWANRSLTRCNR